MNPLRRYEIIMEVLLAQKEVTVVELSERLEVTGKTIREDLAKLEEKGLLVRVHGGAVLAQSDQFGILSAKEPIVKYENEKTEIAELALRYIQPRDIIALDGGSTTLEIARKLDNQPLTVVTNDLFIISELVYKDQIRLVVPGGYRLRNMLAGPEAAQYIRRLNIQKTFLSATGVHLQHGFTIYTNDLVDFKRALIDASATVYGVADHYKFGQCALRTFATLSEVSMILTDSALPAATSEQFRQAGVPVETL
ncbi:DeoR/GlpR family DNA-binding transcription regulator [Paenibacillus aestuarii]|uniref:DeoR/GlpR family DNA-binding transcription regulator n=1 Tax=Paenibacillus aestuarii TaxID=516965 RepID=A0ABW0KCV3_9BACL|nr:DeoR/GlpR family DNA-binding transcription regulator [Paenibacillus aestuarii]